MIRAWDVSELKRSAQYTPALDYAALSVFSEDDKRAAETSPDKSPLAQRGFVHVPATGAHGGIIARGPIQRDVTINFVALRRLKGGDTPALRHYVLGLALVVAVEPIDGFLRAGCLLTADPDSPAEWRLVHRDGTRETVLPTPEVVRSYAQARAQTFGVGADRTVTFDPALAKQDVASKPDKKK